MLPMCMSTPSFPGYTLTSSIAGVAGIIPSGEHSITGRFTVIYLGFGVQSAQNAHYIDTSIPYYAIILYPGML